MNQFKCRDLWLIHNQMWHEGTHLSCALTGFRSEYVFFDSSQDLSLSQETHCTMRKKILSAKGNTTLKRKYFFLVTKKQI